MISRLLALLTSAALASVKYDEDTPITDVRGGVQLQVTYPPNLVDSLDGGFLTVKLGNFGHI